MEIDDHLEKFNCTEDEWNDYKWQLKNSITKKEQLEKYIELNDDEKDAFKNKLKFKITPYYLYLIIKDKENVLRKTCIPIIQENIISEFETEDSLCEEKNSPCRSIVHRYPDRCLFLVTNHCGVNCRFCTRSRIIDGDEILYNDILEGTLYISQHKEIRDVIISGGDPLLLHSSKLNRILQLLFEIKHIEIIRIGTKIPVVLPQRINNDLLKVLDKYSDKLWINIHFTHYKELTEQCIEACKKLSKLGIPLGSQTVLLKGINDNVETMKLLMQKVLIAKVNPRYLYFCDRVKGTKHFWCSIDKGLKIIRGIQGHTTGMSCPRFVIDSQYGKLPLDLSRIVEHTNEYIKFINYENKEIVVKNNYI